jgi:hypothetical protein
MAHDVQHVHVLGSSWLMMFAVARSAQCYSGCGDHIQYPAPYACMCDVHLSSGSPSLTQVLPYLIRRAQENGDIIGRADDERKMLVNAFLKRVFFHV